MNAERRMALAEHVAAVGQRIKELSDRSYFDLPGLNAPEMVFMFVPIESAFVEALKADETLFQKAIEQNVLVATPTTLLTSLNIVRQLWRFENQNKHTAELAERAGKVYDKLRAAWTPSATAWTRRRMPTRKPTISWSVARLTWSSKSVISVSWAWRLKEVWVDRADLELNLISQMPAEQQA
nr:DNA recombination protein RmuC [Pseudomonas aeruginosa]